MSDKVLYSRQHKTNKLFVVFMDPTATIPLKPGDRVLSVSRVDNFFIETTDASSELNITDELISLADQSVYPDKEIYLDPEADLEVRVEDLLQRLTLEEKVRLLHGDVVPPRAPPAGRFFGAGVERLNIPQLEFLDGRQGLRMFDAKGVGHNQSTGKFQSEGLVLTTALPSTLSLSCTWDPDLAYAFGGVLANEMLGVGKEVIFAPMINLIRTPLNGRNFENMGEDPLLAGKTAAAYIRGIQAKNVAACACLLVANDYESNRHYTSSDMDLRTLREIHNLPYEMAVREGKVWTMMSSNSLLNGIHIAHNAFIQQEVMKDEVGFDGVMLTDWRAAYDAVDAAFGGTDMTTGICAYVFGDGRLLKAVKDGIVPESLIDEKARRVIRLMIRTGILNPEILDEGAVDSEEHRTLARRLGSEGMVLLKNDGDLLPLDLKSLQTIMVTGPGAEMVAKGTGSGNVNSFVNVTPLEGLQSAVEGRANLVNVSYNLETDGCPDAFQPLVKSAGSADAVIFFATSPRYSEGSVLADMEMPYRQAEAITALVRANKNVIVVLMTGSAISVEPWADEVPAILGSWFAGQATGDAIADVLLGKFNPGGKLSFTMARELNDYPVHHHGEWPAKLVIDEAPRDLPPEPELRRAIHAYSGEYREGVFVGHRWFEKNSIDPRFEFGYGLSYTTFSMKGLKVKQINDKLVISCTVKNTGKRAGSEVVQVYVAPPASDVPRPLKELKGFSKVRLDRGEKKSVEITIPVSSLAYYNVDGKNWKVEAGEYGILVGNSSRNILLKEVVTLTDEREFDSY
jgi:beta-glucosidase